MSNKIIEFPIEEFPIKDEEIDLYLEAHSKLKLVRELLFQDCKTLVNAYYRKEGLLA